jgi:protease IV
MTTNQVDELAQGRVWSGTDALKRGLVDELGGLDAAVAEAAKRAKLDRYAIVELPGKTDLLEQLLEDLSGKRDPLANLGLPPKVAGEIRAQLKLLNQFNSPSGVYARMPFNLDVR